MSPSKGENTEGLKSKPLSLSVGIKSAGVTYMPMAPCISQAVQNQLWFPSLISVVTGPSLGGVAFNTPISFNLAQLSYPC
jgi:hypothetical protein